MQMIDMTGEKCGRLTVLKRDLETVNKNATRWICECECGTIKSIIGCMLRRGTTKSCGCLARELTAERCKKLFTKEKVPCSYEGCDDYAKTKGYCGKHAQRIRRYNDPSYVTSEEDRVSRQRESYLKNKGDNKKTTYTKYYGRHEHRVIAEKMIGRKLLPDEVVHHIDCNKHNNDESNLQVMTRSAHSKLHAEMNKKC